MTRSEAVKMLNRLLLYCECPHGDCEKCVEAINMAIEALEEETLQNLTKPYKSDLISRQAAIDEMGYCQTFLFDTRDKDKKISLEDALYALERLPSADRPKWIPVSERLPEIDKRVIVTGTMWGLWEVDIDRWNGERWVKYGGYVSAWQPLPEPYKESDGE